MGTTGGRVGRLRRARRVAAALVVGAVGVVVADAPPAGAHTPHDDVFGIAVSPRFADDGTALVVSRGIAFRSTDGTRTWERLAIGLDNRVPLSSIAVACCDRPTYLVASSGDGVYRSSDAGSTWERANDGLGSHDVRLLAGSPGAAGVAFAAGPRELHRTTSAGRSWTRVAYPGGRPTAVELRADRPDEVLVGDADGTVHRSDDLGDTWTSVPVEGADAVTAVVRVPGSDEVLIGTSNLGLLRGARLATGSLRPVGGAAVGGAAVSSIAVSPSFRTDRTIWVSLADQGAAVSRDGGATWHRSFAGLTKSHQVDEAGYEDRSDFGAVAVPPGDRGPEVVLGGFDGLFVLREGADEWEETEVMSSQIVVGLGVSPAFGDDRTVVVSTYMNGIAVSHDGGDTWEPANDGLEDEALWLQGDDRFARLFGVEVIPAGDGEPRLVSARWRDLLVSGDGGQRWTPVAVAPEGEPGPLQQFVLSTIAVPGPGVRILAGTRSGTVYRSDDGQAFRAVGDVGAPVRSIVQVTGPTGAKALAATPRAIVASVDGGATWSSLTDGVRSTTNLAASPGFVVDGTAFAATRRGLFATRDGGATWTVVDVPPRLRSGYVEAVAVSPSFARDGVVLASVRGHGLYRSDDGGRSFAAVGSDLAARGIQVGTYANPTAVPIVFSPTFGEDRTVFASGHDRVLRSRDGGSTWTVLAIAKAVHRGEPDGVERGPTASVAPSSTPTGSTGRTALAFAAGSLAAVVLVAGGLVVSARRRRAGPVA